MVTPKVDFKVPPMTSFTMTFAVGSATHLDQHNTIDQHLTTTTLSVGNLVEVTTVGTTW